MCEIDTSAHTGKTSVRTRRGEYPESQTTLGTAETTIRSKLKHSQCAPTVSEAVIDECVGQSTREN